MNEVKPLELTEDRVPAEGVEDGIAELVELYGGEITAERAAARDFILPLRRGFGGGGAIECTVSWSVDADGHATLRLATNRNIDAPKFQRVLFLLAGAIGSIMFMLWPFFPHEQAYGSLAWLGGLVAIAVYLLTLRKSGGGIAADFLQRLATRQRAYAAAEATAT
jgi:hypothetical protein